MRAVVRLRVQPHYRRDSVCAGLEACGYRIDTDVSSPTLDDVLVIWNRYGVDHKLAGFWEARGARVVVAENGFMGREWRGGLWYSLALGWPSGAGQWPIGGAERAALLLTEVRDWRPVGFGADGEYALVFAQRGIGSPPVAQPAHWHIRAAELLEIMGHRVVIRAHPGAHQENGSLYEQLEHAYCAVTWASGAGVKALLHGVPVYHGLKAWIGAGAARHWSTAGGLCSPFMGDRLPMLQRMAWGMWSVEEIGAGDAFDHLLRRPQEAVQPGPVRSAG